MDDNWDSTVTFRPMKTQTLLTGAAVIVASISLAGCKTDDIASHPVAAGCAVVGTCLAPGMGTAAGLGVGLGIESSMRDDRQDTQIAHNTRDINTVGNAVADLYTPAGVEAAESSDWRCRIIPGGTGGLK